MVDLNLKCKSCDRKPVYKCSRCLLLICIVHSMYEKFYYKHTLVSNNIICLDCDPIKIEDAMLTSKERARKHLKIHLNKLRSEFIKDLEYKWNISNTIPGMFKSACILLCARICPAANSVSDVFMLMSLALIITGLIIYFS